MVGCNKDKKEESALDLGVEALENENVEEAKEQLKQVSEEDKDQAKLYLELIQSAELIDQSFKSEDYDAALDTYYEMKMNENFSKVTFIFADEEEQLEEMLIERANIDGKINALLDFFDPGDPEMSANELYLLKSDDMLKSDYLTSEQEIQIKEFQKAVQKRIEEITAGKESTEQETDAEEEQNQQEAEDENNQQETEEKEEQDKDENTQQENDKPSKDENQSKSLTHEEAKEEVLKYLYGNNVILEDTIEGSNFILDYDHDESGKYVFHLYEIVQPEGEVGHTATVGWYAVDPNTGEVTDNM